MDVTSVAESAPQVSMSRAFSDSLSSAPKPFEKGCTTQLSARVLSLPKMAREREKPGLPSPCLLAVTSLATAGRHPSPPRHEHPNGHTAPPPYPVTDTRSLQRPQNPPSVPRSEPRSTYSLPRASNHTAHSRVPSGGQEMTPDFYYLPSQRKYTGEPATHGYRSTHSQHPQHLQSYVHLPPRPSLHAIESSSTRCTRYGRFCHAKRCIQSVCTALGCHRQVGATGARSSLHSLESSQSPLRLEASAHNDQRVARFSLVDCAKCVGRQASCTTWGNVLHCLFFLGRRVHPTASSQSSKVAHSYCRDHAADSARATGISLQFTVNATI
ncbi:hypothetical protein GWK47_021112 [Chionoecetes opilio]|uniref:Uncharacterized protein n=1 Tax=Chionoecetes opilio TaxID=41210 RepID=A0A8J4XPS0_CHIOP|nr:hypothetical protein GWK47_021112 [Chionoecetes opilio]